MLYVGIDVAKNKHDCFIIDSDGIVHTDNLRVSNDRIGFNELHQAILDALAGDQISNVKVGLEHTGHYSINIKRFLESQGFVVTCFNPLETSAFRKASTLRKTKTDKCDAKVIATMLFSDNSVPTLVPSYQIQELKSLTRHRFRLVGYRGKLKVSIARIIDIVFPEFPDFVWSIHQKSSYKLLLELPAPNDIANCHLTRLTGIIQKGSRGKYGREKAIALRELAASSIGSSDRARAFELQQTIRLVQNVQKEIVALDNEIRSIVTELDTPLLSIPGISYTLAAVILAEIGDVHNFSSPSKLQAYAGLDPSTYQSGKYTASYSTMVKRGSTYLRWAMFQAARLVSMRDKTFADYLAKKRAEGKHFNVALSHVSKKLLRTIYFMLMHDVTFVPQS
jgi:transposase